MYFQSPENYEEGVSDPERTVGRNETDFIESDGSTPVGIEYRHQEFASVKIKGYSKFE